MKTIIPAAPGFKMRYTDTAGRQWVDHVIAWEIDAAAELEVTPICATGHCGNGEDVGEVIQPDGSICRP